MTPAVVKYLSTYRRPYLISSVSGLQFFNARRLGDNPGTQTTKKTDQKQNISDASRSHGIFSNFFARPTSSAHAPLGPSDPPRAPSPLGTRAPPCTQPQSRGSGLSRAAACARRPPERSPPSLPCGALRPRRSPRALDAHVVVGVRRGLDRGGGQDCAALREGDLCGRRRPRLPMQRAGSSIGAGRLGLYAGVGVVHHQAVRNRGRTDLIYLLSSAEI